MSNDIKEYMVVAWDECEVESWYDQYKSSFDTVEEAFQYCWVLMQDYSYDHTQVVRHSDFSLVVRGVA